MKALLFLISIVVLTLSSVYGQVSREANGDKHVGLEIPKFSRNDIIIRHFGYSLMYDENHEQASWVAYELTEKETKSLYNRTDNFIEDPMVKTGTANNSDYKGSGYDRGHLAPAGDMGWSSTSMAESFYYSNMSPQEPSFNRGIWKKLEELLRTWAKGNGSIYVVTGPVLSAGLSSIGPDRVSVPNYYYKVVLDYTAPTLKGIGFILPNAGSSAALQNYAVTIDSVETFTGIDFFPLLPDDIESKIEGGISISSWSWIVTSANSSNDKESSTAIQCNGITQSGNRCKRMTLDTSGFCYQHLSQSRGGAVPVVSSQSTTKSSVTSNVKRRSVSVQCSGTTKAGNRCKRMTYSPNGHCYQHGGN